MQLHQLKPTHAKKAGKRIGRGGKRGTYSGRGAKGQKSRSGTRIRPGFRGGDNPIWKLFPKQRGASKKTDIKHALFQVHQEKPLPLSLSAIDAAFNAGDLVSKRALLKRGLMKSGTRGVKILSTGDLTKKLKFSSDMIFSKSAREKVEKAGGSIAS